MRKLEMYPEVLLGILIFIAGLVVCFLISKDDDNWP
jgi:hypothetical protein